MYIVFCTYFNFTFQLMNFLPTLKVTHVNPSVAKTKLLFSAKDLTSFFQDVDGAIIWAPSDRPLSGSIMKKMMRRIEMRPMNGVTLRPQRQSPKHVATPTIFFGFC